MRYKCVKGLMLDDYDDDGFLLEDSYRYIPVGEEFVKEESDYRIVAGKDSVRLENEKRWIEIDESTFKSHFEAI